MDAPINEIIRNIIHIDKSAVELREKLDKDIEQRKYQTELEIEKMRERIFEVQAQKVEEIEKEELEKSQREVEKLNLEISEKCEKMVSNYKNQKDILIKKLFMEIFS